MNTIDLIVLVVIGISAVNGLRRGFMLGMVDLVALAAALLAGARTADWIADPLRERGFDDPLAGAAGFFIASVVSYTIIGLALRILLTPLGTFGHGTPLSWINSVLGLIPGAIRGSALAALLIIGLSALPEPVGFSRQIAASPFAEPLADAGREALDTGLSWAGVDPDALGLPRGLLDSGHRLPFSGVTEVEVDRDAEQLLLDLANQERAIAGLPPLQEDSELAAVGRRHAREMYRLGFFSHDSPTTGSPTDRLDDAAIEYSLSAENIALAPTAELAHEGLMNSPPYRANLLNPAFSRVGISALHSSDHGVMVTQVFTD